MQEFKEWVLQSFVDHPVYTVSFGLVCFLLGILLG